MECREDHLCEQCSSNTRRTTSNILKPAFAVCEDSTTCSRKRDSQTLFWTKFKFSWTGIVGVSPSPTGVYGSTHIEDKSRFYWRSEIPVNIWKWGMIERSLKLEGMSLTASFRLNLKNNYKKNKNKTVCIIIHKHCWTFIIWHLWNPIYNGYESFLLPVS